jgi:transposase
VSGIAAAGGLTYLGLDVHRDTISVAALGPGREEAPTVDRIANDEPSVRRLVARYGGPHRLRACSEAGPTGFELARLLHRMDVRCQVIAPALIPKAPGDRIKTDSRDCRRLARLHRAGELVAIGVPTVAEEEEAVRDLCRARADMLADRSRSRLRLGGFLLRHGRIWRGGSTTWTVALSGGCWPSALTTRLGHDLRPLPGDSAGPRRRLDAIEADLATWYGKPPFADAVARLAAYRGVTRLGALTLASEVADWRRFATAPQFMGFCGLVPSEYSSGSSTHRGRITKTGNGHLRARLVESAWAYQHRPQATLELRRRQHGLPPEVVARAWTAQLRWCGRFRRLAARKHTRQVAVVAVARELAGFLWAEMTAEHARANRRSPHRSAVG